MQTTGPGTEIVDLTDELAPTTGELEALAEVPTAFTGPIAMERRTGYATDYEWCTWLASALRAAGCSVVEHPGWKTRGRPRSVGPFTPRGLIWHHDASAVGSSPGMAKFIAEVGRPTEGIPAPLSQVWVCAGCNGAHPVGTWHVLAAGRANHAGIGKGWGPIGEDMGTSLTLGVEMDNTTGEKTPALMYDSLVIGTRAILARLGSDPADWLCGHKEFAPGRKVDPDDIDMDKARADVAVKAQQTTLAPAPKLLPYPGAEHFTIGHKCQEGHVDKLKDWLNETTEGPVLRGPLYTKATHARVVGGDVDGVNVKSWRQLQRAAIKAAG